MLDATIAGLVSVVAWPAVGFLIAGILIGLMLGVIPGLSGLTGMAILVPFTYGMEPASAIAFLLGMYAVTTTSDTIASVMLGIPGTSASAATVLDGFPMAQRGEASRAFGAAFTSSAVGGVLGALIAGLSIPIARPLIVLFTSPEILLLGVVGLTMIGSLSGRSIAKGVLAALVGLTLATVGYSQSGAVPRYWFGVVYLLDGIPLVPLILGLFALPELLDLATKDLSISRVARDDVKHGMSDGIRDAIRHWWLVIRGTAIGVYIGILPGLGAGIAEWVAYGHAVHSSKDKTNFGKGDVRGVIAPEAANNSMKGGALIPTIAFGIPGNASMAILLGALLIQGLQPGPALLVDRLDVTFGMVWTLGIANVLGALLLMISAHWVAKAAFIPGRLIVPGVALFVFMGAWMNSGAVGDWIVLLLFGLFGCMMKSAGIPRPPLILGFILGPIMENALYITTMSYDGLEWLLRPTVVVLTVLLILIVGFDLNKAFRRHRSGDRTTITNGDESSSRVISVAVLALLFVGFAIALLQARGWDWDVGLMPMAIAIIGAPLSAVALLGDGRRLLRERSVRASHGDAFERSERGGLAKDLHAVRDFFLWMALIPALTVLLGQLVAMPAFVIAYLFARARASWALTLAYALASWLFLYFLFDRVIHVVWYPAWLLGSWSWD